MPETCPAPRSKSRAGFTLIEVIAAMAVVAISVGAAASAVVTAENLQRSSNFQLNAASIIPDVQFQAYGILADPVLETDLTIDPGTEDARKGWQVLRISSGDRAVRVAFSSPTDTTL